MFFVDLPVIYPVLFKQTPNLHPYINVQCRLKCCCSEILCLHLVSERKVIKFGPNVYSVLSLNMYFHATTDFVTAVAGIYLFPVSLCSVLPADFD